MHFGSRLCEPAKTRHGHAFKLSVGLIRGRPRSRAFVDVLKFCAQAEIIIEHTLEAMATLNDSLGTGVGGPAGAGIVQIWGPGGDLHGPKPGFCDLHAPKPYELYRVW